MKAKAIRDEVRRQAVELILKFGALKPTTRQADAFERQVHALMRATVAWAEKMKLASGRAAGRGLEARARRDRAGRRER